MGGTIIATYFLQILHTDRLTTGLSKLQSVVAYSATSPCLGVYNFPSKFIGEGTEN